MEILRVSEDTLYQVAERAAAVLRRGGVVLFPTDTLYGLAVDATNHSAIARLKQLKARETRKPISVVVEHHEALEEYAHLNDRAREIAKQYMPGPLTLVVPASGKIPHEILLNGTVGLRIPDDAFSLALAKAFGTPYTATSANMTGLPTPATVSDILRQFGPQMQHIDLAIDAGPRSDPPSTVLALVGERSFVLRKGAIEHGEIEA